MTKRTPASGKSKVVALAQDALSEDAGARKLGLFVVKAHVRKSPLGWYVPVWLDGAEGTLTGVMKTLNRVNDRLEEKLGVTVIVTLDPGADA